jgi:hypothetical protein
MFERGAFSREQQERDRVVTGAVFAMHTRQIENSAAW